MLAWQHKNGLKDDVKVAMKNMINILSYLNNHGLGQSGFLYGMLVF